jgi:hypothetical protein
LERWIEVDHGGGIIGIGPPPISITASGLYWCRSGFWTIRDHKLPTAWQSQPSDQKRQDDLDASPPRSLLPRTGHVTTPNSSGYDSRVFAWSVERSNRKVLNVLARSFANPPRLAQTASIEGRQAGRRVLAYPYLTNQRRIGKTTTSADSPVKFAIRHTHGYIAFAIFMMVKAPNRPKKRSCSPRSATS